jgi:hypothetical protein
MQQPQLQQQAAMPVHWANNTALKGYAIPDLKAEASSSELMTTKLTQHCTSTPSSKCTC